MTAMLGLVESLAQPSKIQLSVSWLNAIAHTQAGPLGQYIPACAACAMIASVKCDAAGKF